jgi:hypothetical protein
VILVTHATRSWIPRTAPYLDSLNAHWRGDAWLLTVDCDAPAEFMERFPKVDALRVPTVPGAPEYSASLQHGAFIDYVHSASDDVLIYTDADVVMQRAPTPDELGRLAGLPAGAVIAGYNSGPGETLALEAGRLFPRGDVAAVFGEMIHITPNYNIGVIAARRETWAAIYAKYMTRWDDALATFGAPQRQQWLVCWAMAELGLKVIIPGYGFHANGHHGIPPGVSVNGTANYNGEPVLFRHHL